MAAGVSSLEKAHREHCCCEDHSIAHSVAHSIGGAPKFLLIGGVTFYRWVLSPLKIAILGEGARCRFQPSCSAYALEALQRHGFFYGSWLALRRLLRCHPWGAFGPDPVPVKNAVATSSPLRITAVAGQAAGPTLGVEK